VVNTPPHRRDNGNSISTLLVTQHDNDLYDGLKKLGKEAKIFETMLLEGGDSKNKILILEADERNHWFCVESRSMKP